jgi:hypothetical protein
VGFLLLEQDVTRHVTFLTLAKATIHVSQITVHGRGAKEATIFSKRKSPRNGSQIGWFTRCE